MKSKLMLLFLATLFLSGSCEKDEEYELPTASQNGANTIGCRVNGKVCVPKSSGLFSSKTKMLCYNEQTGELILHLLFFADDEDYSNGIPRTSIYIQIKNVFSSGIIVNNNYSATIDMEIPRYTKGEWYSYTFGYSNLTAEFKITKLDKNNRIISGIFYFEGIQVGGEYYDPANPKKVSISEGRFDLHYNSDGSCIEGYSN